MKKKKKKCFFFFFSGSCGYCKQGENTQYAMNAIKLSVEMYERLLDLNWTRSGCFMYHPLPGSCCPLFQIRLDG